MKRDFAEKVMAKGEDGDPRIERGVEGDFVETLDHEIEFFFGPRAAKPRDHARIISGQPSLAFDLDAILDSLRFASFETRGILDDLMPTRGEAREELEDMRLRASGFRMGWIALVQDEDSKASGRRV